MKRSTARILMAASALWIIGASAALGYGGTIGPSEFVGVPKQATDYKNPLPVAGLPNRYHVTVCNDGNWYGVWYPPEWRGNAGRVSGTPKAYNQHGYAKEEDGTGGGVQIMGNGKGGDDKEITLQKENGQTVYLMIHVIDCSHHAAPRGLLAAPAGVRRSRLPAQNAFFPPNGFGGQTTDSLRDRFDPLPGVGYRASPQIGRPTMYLSNSACGASPPQPREAGYECGAPSSTPGVSGSSQTQNLAPSRGCMAGACASNAATRTESRQRQVR